MTEAGSLLLVTDEPYFQRDLARIQHLGFGFHADACAPGVVELLRDVCARDGLVLEIGCGSGLLTRHLTDAGHRVVATDASPAMLALAAQNIGTAAEIRRLTLPDDSVPSADAIVSVGHVLSYLPNEQAVDRAFVALASALRPGGVLALDICDLEWGRHRRASALPVGPVMTGRASPQRADRHVDDPRSASSPRADC